jgi:membrane protease YdiL (CAAX protease family)
MNEPATPLPTANDPPPTWGGAEVILALLLYAIWPVAVFQALEAGGVFDRLYGGERVTAYVDRREGRNRDANDLDSDLGARLNLWTQAVAFPLQAVTIPLAIFLLRGVRPAAFGLTLRDWRRNLVRGVVAWLFLTPLVWLVFFLAIQWTRWSGLAPIEEHSLTRLAESGMAPAEWILWLLAPLVFAPVMEELLFRGLIQGWLRSSPVGDQIGVALSLLVAVLTRWDRLAKAVSAGGDGMQDAVLPTLFVLAAGGGFMLLRRFKRPPPPGVFGAALLFGMAHVAVWPSPIPLFVLGLGLGVLAEGTRSLVGPIVVHSAFNAVSCGYLALKHLH